jgi:phenylpyruvate tautomerase PptA (4-oxalocrotonate tautomerase family)
MPLITVRYTTQRQSGTLKADIAESVSQLAAQI